MATDKDKNLIDHLVNETYSLVSKSEDSTDLTDLNYYFTNKTKALDLGGSSQLLQFLILKKISFSRLVYLDDIKCFRVFLKNDFFDFPVNWGLFKEVYSGFESGCYKLIRVKEVDDTLFEVLASFVGGSLEPILITISNEVYISFISESDLQVFKSIREVLDSDKTFAA